MFLYYRLGVDLDDMSDLDSDDDSNHSNSNQGSSTSQQSDDPDTTNSRVNTEPTGASSVNSSEQNDSQLHKHSDNVSVKPIQEDSNKEEQQTDTLPVKVGLFF